MAVGIGFRSVVIQLILSCVHLSLLLCTPSDTIKDTPISRERGEGNCIILVDIISRAIVS